MKTITDVIEFIASASKSALLEKRVFNCLWELTYRCTARCGICSYWKQLYNPKNELELRDIQRGLNYIYKFGCRVVNFTGGEPTLRSDLEDIIYHASNLKMWTSLVTNGSLITRQRLNLLKAAGLDNLFISLDSVDPTIHDRHRGVKDLYSKVLDCMKWLDEDFLTGHRTGGVMCVLSNMNLGDTEEIIMLAEKLGVYVVFQPYHSKKTGNSEFSTFIDEEAIDRINRLKMRFNNVLCSSNYLKRFSQFSLYGIHENCHAGQKYFSIDPYGFLHPCVDMPAAGHILYDDISVVRSVEALNNIKHCSGCWYCFRGEADSTMSYKGCLEKIYLFLTVVMHNEKRRINREINKRLSIYH